MENTTPVSQQPVSPKVDTYSYKGWMNSDSFLKRAFGVYGYNVAAGLIITIPIMVLVFLVSLLLIPVLN